MHPGSFVSKHPKAKEQGTQEDEATFHHRSAFRSGVFFFFLTFQSENWGNDSPFDKSIRFLQNGSFKHHGRVGWPLSLCLTRIPELGNSAPKKHGNVRHVFVVKVGGEIATLKQVKKRKKP